MKESLRRQEGITLIALIITIIILVILAAVSIRAVYEMGIVGYAINGTQQYAERAKEENEMLGQTVTKLEDAVSKVKEIQGGTTTQDPTNPGDEPETPPTAALTVGERATSAKKTYQDVPIPEGFTVSGVSGEATSEDDGIVIYDIPSTVDTTVEGFWTKDENSNDIPDVQEDYNQFVWVPVATAYVTQASLQTLIDDTNKTEITDEKTALQSLVNAGTYPMAVQYTGTINGEAVTCYRGVLYDFAAGTNGITMTVKDFSTTEDYVNTANYYREPAYLTDSSYADASSYNPTVNGEKLISQAKLQREYNAMVNSVAKNGGFYVARYELSYNSTALKGESKRAKTVSTAADDATKYWYGLYSVCQGMYNQTADKVQSLMITGAQYDQIMIWMRNVKNTSNDTKYYIKDSTGMGYYGQSSKTTSGSNNAYAVKKVFDLAGNQYEWTSEANDTDYRAIRGGCWDNNGSNFPASGCSGYSYPNYDNDGSSSRSTLYIKP